MSEVANGNHAARSRTHVPRTDGFNRKRQVGLWAAPSSRRAVFDTPPVEAALLSLAQAFELAKRLLLMAGSVEQRCVALAVQAGRADLNRTTVPITDVPVGEL